jgi:ribosomal protein S13
VPGIGRRISNIVLKKAEVDLNKRAGEMTADEIERVVGILQNPQAFHIPEWMVNRRMDRGDGKTFHMVSNQIATKVREDLEALKKVRAHRGLPARDERLEREVAQQLQQLVFLGAVQHERLAHLHLGKVLLGLGQDLAAERGVVTTRTMPDWMIDSVQCTHGEKLV